MTTPKIVYQDDDLLVLDKPPGLVVDSGESVKKETLVDILRREYGIGLESGGPPATHAPARNDVALSGELALRAGIVHRLDKDTSGILLVAKSAKALDDLQNQFKERVIKKEYLALAHGYVEESGRVEAAIMRNPRSREKFTVALQGVSLEAREAVTEYEPIKLLAISQKPLAEIFSDFNKIQMRKLEKQHYGEFTLLRCRPETGRTHQIRVHLKYIGHPIVSDDKYGGRKTVRLDKRWCPRMFLHAAKIGFHHPVSGEWVELESPLPEDLKKALDYLKT